MHKIKLGIAEDHKQFRSAIKRTIHLENDLEIVLEADNGKELLEKLQSVQPEVLLMDIRMPIMNGIEASLMVKDRYPSIKIIAFSQYDHEENIIKMNICGVKSFIGKEDDPEELFKAIRTVYSGGVYMTDRSAKIVQRNLSYHPESNKSLTLTDFEYFLVKVICEGKSSTEIGAILNRSYRTIEEHRQNLYKKFGVRTKEQLLREVYKRNLV